MKILEIETRSREELIDITHLIAKEAQAMGIKDGGIIVFVPHTTAGLTINENADPSVKRDILMAFRHIVPDNLPYVHTEGNSPAHIKASLCGSSLYIIVKEGRLCLGTWQGITFCEFDGPRHRRLFISPIKL